MHQSEAVFQTRPPSPSPRAVLVFRQMARLGEVAFLLNLLLLLETLHSIAANLDDFEEEEYDFDSSVYNGANEEPQYDYEEEEGGVSPTPGTGNPPSRDLPITGVLTSPNYPQNYPNDLNQTQTIRVPKGNIIVIQFSDFQLEYDRTDYVVITDQQNSYDNRDGTKLAKFDGRSPRLGGWEWDGYGDRYPIGWATRITSFTESVTVSFITDKWFSRKGWRLEWGE